MQKALNMLGLCARAGKIVTGEKMTEKAVKNGSGLLVIMDGGISDTGRKSVTDACAYKKVAYFTVGKGALGSAIGKDNRMALAVTDKGFAERIAYLLRESTSDTGVQENNG